MDSGGPNLKLWGNNIYNSYLTLSLVYFISVLKKFNTHNPNLKIFISLKSKYSTAISCD